MDLEKTLETDLLEAMKARDEIRVQVLRLVKAAMKNQAIEVRADLTPQQMLAVLQKEAKKRQDSISQYRQAGRDDLANKEQAELTILESYLPEQVSEEAIKAEVKRTIAEMGSSANMGQVIGAVREHFSGAVDGSTLASIVREELQNNQG